MPNEKIEIAAVFERVSAEPERVRISDDPRLVLSPQMIAVNGAPARVEAYNIDGTKFFKLRDLAAYLGYLVDYDAATNTARIESK